MLFKLIMRSTIRSSCPRQICYSVIVDVDPGRGDIKAVDYSNDRIGEEKFKIFMKLMHLNQKYYFTKVSENCYRL